MRRSLVRSSPALLLTLWLSGFLLNLGIVLALAVLGWVETDNLKAAAKSLNVLYAPYLGPILAYWFSARRLPRTTNLARATSGVGIVVSLTWNLIVVGHYFLLLFGVGAIEDVVERTGSLTGVLAWFVGPALGYFFWSQHPAPGAARAT